MNYYFIYYHIYFKFPYIYYYADYFSLSKQTEKNCRNQIKMELKT